jgi:hypothetical protein
MNEMQPYKEIVNSVVDYFGGWDELALQLNIAYYVAHKWKQKGVPASRAIQIEKLTNGHFKAADLFTIKTKKRK